MDEHYATLTDMMVLLMKDVLRTTSALKQSTQEDEREFWARNHARVVFAAIEGTCELFQKQAFVVELKKVPNEIWPGKLSVLAGETYSVTDGGEIRMQRIRTPFLANVLWALNSYAEAQGAKYRTKKGDDWHRIRAAVNVRDRITHPKNLKALEITKDEIADIDFTLKWFLNETAAVLRDVGCDMPPIAY